MTATEEGPAVVAVIPARGGSKGVPGKNLKAVGGRPLVVRAIDAARAAGIDAVWVSTDDGGIARTALAAGARVVERPHDIAGDGASSESALLHALDELAEGNVLPRALAFLQATSPFIDAAALARAVDRVLAGSDDVVLAAAPTHGFLWSAGPDGATPVNHEAHRRPRRQDRAPQHLETGAFYVLDVAGFLEHRFRFFGRIGLEAVDPITAVEIDTAEELEVARRLAPWADARTAPTRLAVDALVMDFDGVHTDDRVVLAEDGSESVRLSRADGYGVELLRRAGVPMLILSRERNPVVAARGRKLGVPVLHGVDDKASALTAWCAEQGVALDRVAYLGNDVADAECLALVGTPVVVADAHPSVVGLARVVLTRRGGSGAVRELAEMVLAARELEELG